MSELLELCYDLCHCLSDDLRKEKLGVSAFVIVALCDVNYHYKNVTIKVAEVSLGHSLSLFYINLSASVFIHAGEVCDVEVENASLPSDDQGEHSGLPHQRLRALLRGLLQAAEEGVEEEFTAHQTHGCVYGSVSITEKWSWL